MKRYFRLMAIFLVISFIYSAIYTVGQQILRMDANDPQIQLAEDDALLLDHGTVPSTLFNGTTVDIRNSLAPFVIIYNKSGQALVGSGYLDNKLPDIPIGVLTNTNSGTTNRVTWQPSGDVRIAAVSTRTNNYFVLAGRNLIETEKRENFIFQIVSVSWIITWLLIGIFYWLGRSGQSDIEIVHHSKLKPNSR